MTAQNTLYLHLLINKCRVKIKLGPGTCTCMYAYCESECCADDLLWSTSQWVQ